MLPFYKYLKSRHESFTSKNGDESSSSYSTSNNNPFTSVHDQIDRALILMEQNKNDFATMYKKISKLKGRVVKHSLSSRISDHTHPILHAIESGDLEKVKECMPSNRSVCDVKTKEKLIHCHYDGFTFANALEYAIIHKQYTITKYLIKYGGVNIHEKNTFGQTPLYIAASYGTVSMVKYLLKKGSDLYTKANHNQSILHIASLFGRADIVKFLFQSNRLNINVKDENGNTPLHFASCYYFEQSKELINLFLSFHSPMNTKNYHGDTPLTFAVEYGNLEMIDFLIEKGANLFNRDIDQRTLLHIAIKNEHANIVPYLKQHGIHINSIDRFGNTILHEELFRHGSFITCKLLIEEGIEVNVKNKFGETPLYLLCKLYLQSQRKMDYIKIAELLLKNGASTLSETMKGDTPMQFVKRENCNDLYQLFMRNRNVWLG